MRFARYVFLFLIWLGLCYGQRTTEIKGDFLSLAPRPVAELPVASNSNIGRIAIVRNGASASDCTAGGGSSQVTCISTGSSWTAQGGGSLITAALTPVAPTLVKHGAGAESWGYACTAVNSVGESVGSSVSASTNAATLDGTNYFTVTCPAVSLASTCKIYITTAGSGGTTGLVHAGACGDVFNDQTGAGDGAAPPYADQSSGIYSPRLIGGLSHFSFADFQMVKVSSTRLVGGLNCSTQTPCAAVQEYGGFPIAVGPVTGQWIIDVDPSAPDMTIFVYASALDPNQILIQSTVPGHITCTAIGLAYCGDGATYPLDPNFHFPFPFTPGGLNLDTWSFVGGHLQAPTVSGYGTGYGNYAVVPNPLGMRVSDFLGDFRNNDYNARIGSSCSDNTPCMVQLMNGSLLNYQGHATVELETGAGSGTIYWWLDNLTMKWGHNLVDANVSILACDAPLTCSTVPATTSYPPGVLRLGHGTVVNDVLTVWFDDRAVLSQQIATSGGSAGKATCWKTDAKTIGYCSTAVGADGSCTCN